MQGRGELHCKQKLIALLEMPRRCLREAQSPNQSRIHSGLKSGSLLFLCEIPV